MTNVLLPHSSMNGQRDAICLIIGLGALVCGGAAVVGGSGAEWRSVASGKVFLHSLGWYDRNDQSTGLRSVREAPLCFICMGYHWESSVSSEKAEKWSNCQMWYQYTGTNTHVNEQMIAGKGSVSWNNRQMTQQTVTN
jgi:hypothetical protein